MLKEILNEKIKDSSLEELKKKLAYKSTIKFQKTIDKFLKTDTVYDWLYSGFYDFANSSQEFLNKLCKEFKIDEKLLEDELLSCKKLNVEIEKFKGSYLYINTNFKRKSEPIFVLAVLENKRRISLYKNKKLLFKSKDQILKIISNIIIEHYKSSDSKCSIWGEIINYQLHLFDDLYTYLVDGKLLDEKENLDTNFASIKI